jgi:hypothetical protein
MSKRQQIEFIIKQDGTVEERVSGLSGPDCRKITEGIERALGDVTQQEPTSEFYLEDDGQQASETITTSN